MSSLRLRVLALHPIQYQAPLWAALALNPAVGDFEVWFGSRGLSGREAFDPGFDRRFAWDVDLGSGYRHRYLRNLSFRPGRGGIFSRINPSVLWRVPTERPDALIVVGHGTITSMAALAMGRLVGVPTILFGDYSTPRRRWMASVRRRVVALASGGAATGVRNRSLYLDAGLTEDRVIAVPYCVENARFARPATAPPRPSRPVVIFVAKLIALKRHRDVLEALSRVTPGRRPMLRIVGSGPEETVLRDLAGRLGIAQDVEWPGFANYSEMPAEYWRATASILASDQEQWGLTINESMAAGVPAIVSQACGCVEDLVVEGETGHRFSVGDVAHIASLLQNVHERPERWLEMGRAAQRHIMRYDVSVASQNLVDGIQAIRKALVA